MSVKKYNALGMEVRSPIYFLDQPETIAYTPPQTSKVYVYYSPEQSLVNFKPSDNFGLKISRESDSTININLRFNPKQFLTFATEGITSIALLRKAICRL